MDLKHRHLLHPHRMVSSDHTEYRVPRTFMCVSLKDFFPMVRRLPSGPREGRSHLWRALCEPFDKTQDRVREWTRPPQASVPPLP